MRLRGASVHLISVLASASVIVNAAAPAAAQTAPVQGDDPFNVVYSVDIGKDGSVGKLSTAKLSDRDFSVGPADPTPKKDLVQPKDPGRLQPELEQLIATGDPDATISVL